MDNHTVHVSPLGALEISKRSPWATFMPWMMAALSGYALAQQYLRYQRLNTMKKKYNYHTRQDLAKMTDRQAWEIINNLAELEFCTMFEKGIV